MKYKLTPDNIEFYIKNENTISLIEAILKTLVPSEITKLYYSSKQSETIKEYKDNRLVIIHPDQNDNALLSKPRLLQYEEYLILVPSPKGKLTKTKWQNICKDIQAAYNESA